MTFIIILAALIIERFFDWNHIRRWQWFINFQKWLGLRFSTWPAYLVLFLTILPSVLVVGLLSHFLSGWVYGILKLLFGAVVLVYCLGPINFWAQAYNCITALSDEDHPAALKTIKSAFGVSGADDGEAFHRAFTSALVVEANRRVFAVLFWFILLGPSGAVLYREVDFCRLHGVLIKRPAGVVIRWLDWLPVRVFTFIFALAGHFTRVLKHWKHDAFTSPKHNETMLSECGIAALDVVTTTGHLPVNGSAEKELLGLIDRSLVIGLVILAIVVLL